MLLYATKTCPPRTIYYSEVFNFPKGERTPFMGIGFLVNAMTEHFLFILCHKAAYLLGMGKVSFDKLEAYLKFSSSEPLSQCLFRVHILCFQATGKCDESYAF